MDANRIEWLRALSDWPHVTLAQRPTPMHRLANLERHAAGAELLIKRERVLRLANARLGELGDSKRLAASEVEIVVGDTNRFEIDLQPLPF